MQRNRTLLAVCFCAGLLGALFNSLIVWLAGKWGLTAMAGVALAPELTTAWLYPRLIWGGIWGLAYDFTVAHPRDRRRWVRKGLWISVLPTLFQLFYLFPQRTGIRTDGARPRHLHPHIRPRFQSRLGFFHRLFHPSALGPGLMSGACRWRIYFATSIMFLLFTGGARAEEVTGKVEWVYDGDTVRVAGLGRVRLLGIDTPEKEARSGTAFIGNGVFPPAVCDRSPMRRTAFSIAEAKGKTVRLGFDGERRDGYGRLLAYVYLPDGRLLNRLLLEKGFASVYRRADFRLKQDFLAAEARAKKRRDGLWQ